MPEHPLLCHFTRRSFFYLFSPNVHGIRRLGHQRKKINKDCMTYASNINVLSTTVCVVDLNTSTVYYF